MALQRIMMGNFGQLFKKHQWFDLLIQSKRLSKDNL